LSHNAGLSLCIIIAVWIEAGREEKEGSGRRAAPFATEEEVLGLYCCLASTSLTSLASSSGL